MIKVVNGAGASGKSSFAESLLEQSEAKRKIYAATMIVWDDECRARVKKHRQMREKKGFETAERPVDLGELFVPEDGAVLVECMSNLAANEMYREDVGMESCAELRAAQAGERILRGLRLLAEAARDLVVVTNEVFGDIKLTEEETAAYQRLMGRLNRELFSMAGEVWEVVCGIPVQLKGRNRPSPDGSQNKKGEESLHMKFITGGAFQGKRDFAEQLLAREDVLEYETADGAADPFEAAYSRKLVVNVQDYVRRFAGLEDGEARERLQEFLDRLIKENPGAVAVMDEIGCGIVPVGREERLWRDLAGEAAQTLAACSRDVYRVTGGLAQVLKGGER